METRARAGRRVGAVAAAALLVCAPPPGARAGGPASEAELQVALAYVVLKFVQWPGGAEGPMALCALDAPGFAEVARAELEDRPVGGRPLRVREARDLADARSCEVVFVGAAGPHDLERAAFLLAEAGVVTFGHGEGLGASGIQFNFYADGGRLRLEVNLAAARRAGVKVSSKLLALARLVGEEDR